MREIILNAGQEQSLADMNHWASNPVTDQEPYFDQRLFFRLTGSAGTGKTTIVNDFLNANRNLKVCVTAPTHKAKIVVERVTGQKSETIQKLCGLRPNTELEWFDINRPVFDPLAKAQIEFHDVILVDESSMINRDLYKVLTEKASLYGTKVMFIGDPLQLPPVNEAKSKAFTDERITFSAHLDEIVRQEKGNPLLELLGVLRKDIEQGTTKYLDVLRRGTRLNDQGQGYVVIGDKDQFRDIAVKLSRESIDRKDTSFSKYLAWTNNSVKGANSRIREFLVDKEADRLINGEVLLSYKSIYEAKADYYRLINSEDYEVIDISESRNQYDIEGKTLVIRGSTGQSTRVFVVDKGAYEKYIVKHDKLLSQAKQYGGRAWGKYYDFDNANLLLEDLRKRGKIVRKKAMDYGYGITVHKSQGSTYENVVINATDIHRNKRDYERKRLMYVAMSRASNVAYIYG